jgi:hypothetical protein
MQHPPWKRKVAGLEPTTFVFIILLVPLAGVELATFALRMRCSTN